jgi:molybdate transport system substrate-binding protein
VAKQIEQGAPAQMFISADLDWMDYVAQKNLIKPDTRSNPLGNRISHHPQGKGAGDRH